MAKAKRSRKKKAVKTRQPVVRRAPAKPKTPKGYKKQTNSRIDSKPKKLTKAQKQAAEIKRLRAELRQSKKAHKSQKATNVKLQRVNAKIEKLGGVKGIKRILKRRAAVEHRHQVRKHRKEIISKVRDIVSLDGPYEDLEDYERDELLEELREDYDLDLEDWLDIMTDEGYTEHEAYELWYGYS